MISEHPHTIIGGRWSIYGLPIRGGMSVLFPAVDGAGTKAMIKFSKVDADDSMRARFEAEGRALLAAPNPNTVRLIDSGMDVHPQASSRTPVPYLVLEHVDGVTLEERMRQTGPMGWDEAAGIAVGVLNGLRHLHAAGIIHRDLCPRNIMISPDGHATIIDLGIALSPSSSPRLTEAGSVIGKWRYMSPEQMDACPVDPRTDLYSLAVVLFELLSGRHPFPVGDSPATMRAKQSPDWSAIFQSFPGSAAVGQLLITALSPRPEDRYPTAASMSDAVLHVASFGGTATQAIASDTATTLRGAGPGPQGTRVLPTDVARTRVEAPLAVPTASAIELVSDENRAVFDRAVTAARERIDRHAAVFQATIRGALEERFRRDIRRSLTPTIALGVIVAIIAFLITWGMP